MKTVVVFGATGHLGCYSALSLSNADALDQSERCTVTFAFK
jgi:hypothetical protein